MQVDLPSGTDSQLETLFAEELGLVLEVAADKEQEVINMYRTAGLIIENIGEVTTSGQIDIGVAGESCINGAHSLTH